MSVINQMLQDLEKRNTVSGDSSSQVPVMVSAPQKSPFVPVILAIVITAIIAAVLWLFVENQSLKERNQSSIVSTSVPPLDKAVSDVEQGLSQSSVQTSGQTPRQPTSESTAQQQQAVKVSGIETTADNKALAQTEAESVVINDTANAEFAGAKSIPASLPNASEKSQSQPPRVNNIEQVAVTKPLPSEMQVSSKQNDSRLAEKNLDTKAGDKAAQANKPSLTIARKQLSSSQLAAQKIKQAEQAMGAQQGEQAEQLLQDALLLMPNNKQARKQLAAIWFARGNNQAAVNLLNQGISLSPLESDFRLMKGKMLLQGYQRTQFQTIAQDSPLLTQAYDTLVAQPDVSQVEYQALLASVAQQLNKLPAATSAYQQLVILQPNQAKWQLGLATVLDQASRFNNALAAYQQAVAIGGLSTQSRQFAEQRIKELGE